MPTPKTSPKTKSSPKTKAEPDFKQKPGVRPERFISKEGEMTISPPPTKKK